MLFILEPRWLQSRVWVHLWNFRVGHRSVPVKFWLWAEKDGLAEKVVGGVSEWKRRISGARIESVGWTREVRMFGLFDFCWDQIRRCFWLFSLPHLLFPTWIFEHRICPPAWLNRHWLGNRLAELALYFLAEAWVIDIRGTLKSLIRSVPLWIISFHRSCHP